MRIWTAALLAATAIGLAVGPAAATDLDAAVDGYSARWIEQTVVIERNTVEDGSAIGVGANDVNLSVRSGARDRFDLEIDTNTIGYIKQNVTITNNTVRDNSLVDVSAGAFSLRSYGG